MNEELMPLGEIDSIETRGLVSTTGVDFKILCKTARAAHSLKDENEKLRAVFEAARRVLRFNGVDNRRTIEAVNALDDAIEVVKAADSGSGEDL